MLDKLQIQFLRAVDQLTRDSYGVTDGAAIIRVLRAEGVTQNALVLDNLARELRTEGYLADHTGFTWGGGDDDGLGIYNVSLTSFGRDEARGSDPFDQVAADVLFWLSSEPFEESFPDAFESWAKASELLRGDDATQHLSAIGHHAREAMQAFATALVVGLDGVDPDVTKVERRVGNWIATHRSGLGEARREALEALGTLWERTNRLVQRQEHSAQKEGEPVTVDDARRVVFLTMMCMVEFAAAQENLPPDEPATLEAR